MLNTNNTTRIVCEMREFTFFQCDNRMGLCAISSKHHKVLAFNSQNRFHRCSIFKLYSFTDKKVFDWRLLGTNCFKQLLRAVVRMHTDKMSTLAFRLRSSDRDCEWIEICEVMMHFSLHLLHEQSEQSCFLFAVEQCRSRRFTIFSRSLMCVIRAFYAIFATHIVINSKISI